MWNVISAIAHHGVLHACSCILVGIEPESSTRQSMLITTTLLRHTIIIFPLIQINPPLFFYTFVFAAPTDTPLMALILVCLHAC